MITNSDVVELLQYGERITLECKDSRNEISKSVWKHIRLLLTHVVV